MKFILKLILSLFLVIIYENADAQYNFCVVRGNVINEQTGVFVVGALIHIPKIEKEIITDEEGYFVFGTFKGTHEFIISHPDFHFKEININIKSDTFLTIELEPIYRSLTIDEATITTNEIDKLEIPQMSMERVTPKTFNRIPVMAGEKDAVKAFQLFPGIQSGTEGTADLFVRGGTPDQNLFLLDNTSMYNSSHLMGFLSSYNPLSISQIDLYKAGFPPKYGGRLSSILDAVSREPTYRDLNGTINVGILSAKGFMEIPLKKDKLSLMLSGRRSYFDIFSKLFQGNRNYESLNFHDGYSKLSLNLEKSRIDLWGYFDRDRLYEVYTPYRNSKVMNNIFKRNQLATLHWNYQPAKRISNALYLSTTGYKYQIEDIHDETGREEDYHSKFESTIRDFTLKELFQLKTNNLNWQAGAEITFHRFIPSTIEYRDVDSTYTLSKMGKQQTTELNWFINAHYHPSDKFDMQMGLRNSNFFTNNFNGTSYLEPRISFSFALSKHSKMKASYSRMTQPFHLLTNPGLGKPVDLWLSADDDLVPESSNQIALGFYQNIMINKQQFVFSLESYYKSMKDIIAYKDGYSSHNFASEYAYREPSLEGMVTSGTGHSYGTELLIDKKTGALTGWLGYTLSWTKHHFDELNDGRPFYARYDRRHDISLVGFYRFNDKSEISANWVYGTGQAITLPVSAYSLINFDFSSSKPRKGFYYSYLTMYENSERNAYRMLPYHRLDISYRRFFDIGKKKAILEFSIYNLYNRKNPYYYYVHQVHGSSNPDGPSSKKRVLSSVSVFPIMPSVSFQYSF